MCELTGMAIGGSMSSAAVSARFAHEESRAFSHHLPDRFQNLSAADVQWARYVDDVLSFSLTVCSGCLAAFFGCLYSAQAEGCLPSVGGCLARDTRACKGLPTQRWWVPGQ